MIRNKKAVSFLITLSITLSMCTAAFADRASVVTLGADLSDAQKQTVLNYFGVKKDDVVVLDVNNAEERKYLQGIASEAQIGTKTYSCAYVQPTKSGNGINVKTVNLTYVTSSMIASTLATCGVEDANVIAMTPLSGGVSGTGALTGVILAFEDATGEKLDETKKELASQELITTSDLGDQIGQDEATGIVNDVKADIIKNGTKDTTQIANTINNVTNNYNVTLNQDQEKQLQNLMSKIAEQDYDYSKLKNTFKNVSEVVDEGLEGSGIKVKHTTDGFFQAIGDWFSNLFSNKDLGILEQTNENELGDNVKVDATNKEALKNVAEKGKGFFQSIKDWLFGTYKSNNDSNDNSSSESAKDNTPATSIDSTNTTEYHSTTDDKSNSSNDNSQSNDSASNTKSSVNSNDSQNTSSTAPNTQKN
ncbi:DUF1002 domain-containing protein [Clostridium sp. SM-530-WT-3G]|uniref:DUF1002 domain-containing protein n=1 Tax=Clostridium sp. SM-530-WT-3G TaxID=2725303 RepID=UPI00145E3427|nr:DUF1002 domain-containing protein [Clostridium sp. SM-530-WT-3G]NME84255.1 DUF1002 domain-containing protein [Clostridium sp. SM-530-WT-3G]